MQKPIGKGKRRSLNEIAKQGNLEAELLPFFFFFYFLTLQLTSFVGLKTNECSFYCL